MPALNQYLHEIRTCGQLGATWGSRARLAAATMEFHVANFLHWNHTDAGPSATGYRVCLRHGPADLQLRRRSGDLFILHEIFTTECYRLPDNLVQHPATIVDLGANIGLTTLFFSQQFPNARYVCVEPSHANARILRKNVAVLGDGAQVIEAAISDQSGEATFDDTGWSWGGRLTADGQPGRIVRSCTMDDIITSCRLEKIDLLKVDVEGAEKQLFRQTPKWLGQVRSIIIELHDGYSLRDFQSDVAPAGLTVIPPASVHGNEMVMAVRVEGKEST